LATSTPTATAGDRRIRGRAASGVASLGRVPALGELLDDLGAEGGQVIGLTAGHQTLLKAD
jgi:hypothetical protein